MNLRRHLLFPAIALLSAASLAQTGTPAPQPMPDGRTHTFVVRGNQFLLDGKPFRIISGEMHYPRIPREYWRARLKMARAMGLNAITTYVFWNEHEPRPGVYDFSGNNDVAEFIREAQQEGLWVILRPGPYVCAEWEFGGYPAWLEKDPATVVRSSDPKFMQPATRWLKRLGQELAPLQVGNGGPILLVQVENEYGSFGSDHAYMEANKRALMDAGFTKAQLYTADGPKDVPNGSLPELPVGINFDGNKPGEAQKAFATLKTERPDNPLFNSEFWAGWFDHWGGPHAHTNTAAQAANLAWELAQGASVSIYMFHGGTDFGWMNGANSNDVTKPYEPDVTSYDYDAALDESGRPTAKFYAFREVITKATGVTPPPVPEVAAPIAVARFKLNESVSLWDSLPKPIESDRPLTMEDLGQSYGWILYRAKFAARTGELTIHDYAQMYFDGEPAPGPAFDRRLRDVSFRGEISDPAATAASHRLDVLVENMGRINYSHQLLHDRKGIVGYKAPASGGPVKWEIYPLPMTDVASLKFAKGACSGPCFYRGHFAVSAVGDTFLDTSGLGKGELWVNGHAMGRFWNIGPQRTLYVPGPWLKQGENEVIVFDVDGSGVPEMEGLTKAELGE
ncbi:MAG TPA: glycoside hydrolase family 35 protein [Acidobacteriaceae bacterium]|nr:glycoside hydrolase family 35 protein [Acidobacteriaceae bacterium]